MKKDVLITIKGIQKAQGERDSIELTTRGQYRNRGDLWQLIYEESEMTGFPGCKTVLSVYGDHKVVMERKGPSRSQLIIEKGKRHQCFYQTEYGQFMLGVSAQSIDNSLTQEGGDIRFGYTLDVNTSLASENEVYISVKECNRKDG